MPQNAPNNNNNENHYYTCVKLRLPHVTRGSVTPRTCGSWSVGQSVKGRSIGVGSVGRMMVGWSVGQLVSWSVGRSVGQSVGRSVSWSVGQSVGREAATQPHSPVSRSVQFHKIPPRTTRTTRMRAGWSNVGRSVGRSVSQSVSRGRLGRSSGAKIAQN